MNETELAEQLFRVVPGVMAEMRKRVLSIEIEDVTLPQFRILTQLKCQTSNNREIAETLGLSVTTMSRMVDVLVEKGLVKRVQSAKDRRQVTLGLTRKGKQKFDNVHRQMIQWYARELAAMDPNARKTLSAGLGLLEVFSGCGKTAQC